MRGEEREGGEGGREGSIEAVTCIQFESLKALFQESIQFESLTEPR